MGWQDVALGRDVSPADWIADRLHPFAQDVGSVIPTGFAAYARIFHPAWARRDPNAEEEVRWSSVAAWSGRTVHPEMQFHSIASAALPGGKAEPSPWDFEPRLGVLSTSQSRALTALLTRFTAIPETCWFGLWDGYGYLHPGGSATSFAVFARPPLARAKIALTRLQLRLSRPKPPDPATPRVRLPNRDYLLFQGPIDKAEGWEDGPNIWWPEDRAWCVASEIDFPYTYVGGSQELVDAIIKDPAIEALPATVADGISYSSDTVNT